MKLTPKQKQLIKEYARKLMGKRLNEEGFNKGVKSDDSIASILMNTRSIKKAKSKFITLFNESAQDIEDELFFISSNSQPNPDEIAEFLKQIVNKFMDEWM